MSRYRYVFGILFFILAISTGVTLNAQVTIGAGNTPRNGLLLDLKENENSGHSPNTNKALGLPRISLSSLTTLTIDADPEKDLYVGAIVYNVNNANGLKEGIYSWDGSKWVEATAAANNITAENGVTSVDNKITLGGDIIDTVKFTMNKKKPIIYQMGFSNLTIGRDTLKFEGRNDGVLRLDNSTTGKPVFFGDIQNHAVGIGTTTPKYTLQVEGTNWGTASFGTSNAALKLDSDNRGFMPPRVTLTGSTDKTTVTVAAADKGMVVYHKGNAAMSEGIYIWNGTTWMQLITEIPVAPSTQANSRDLQTTANLPVGDWINPDKGVELDFGGDIVLPQNGSYTFLLRFYGSIQMTNPYSNPFKQPFYVFLLKNGIKVDAQELQEAVVNTSVSFGCTGSLTVTNVKAGDKITIRAARGAGSYSLSNMTLGKGDPGAAARTSVVFWKL